jgi:hypothetical protein
MISTTPPFVLRFSKDERKVFSRIKYNLILRRSTVVSAPVQQSELAISPWSLEIKLRQFRVEARIGLNPFHSFDPFLPWAVAQSPALSEANAKLGSSSVCLRTTTSVRK